MSRPAAIDPRARNLMPLFDLFLTMVLAVYGIAGFEHLEKGAGSTGRPDSYADAGGDPAGAAATAPSAEGERLERRLQDLNSEAAALRKILAGQGTESTPLEARPSPSTAMKALTEEAGELAAALDRMRAELDRLSTENDSREKQISALAAVRSRVAWLESQLEHTRTVSGSTRDEMARALDGASTPPDIRVESTPLMNASTGRKPLYVVFSRGHVLQLREPFYTLTQEAVQRANGRFELLERALRRSEGELVDTSLHNGSLLSRMLSEIQADTQYVAMLVDRASFSAFRRAREEVRKRNLRFGWEPLLSADAIVLSAGGQVIGEEIGARPR